MALTLQSYGPKPRRFKSRSFSPNRGYWWAWIAGRSRPLCRWTITDLGILDQIYAEKVEHFKNLDQQAADKAAIPMLTTLEKEALTVKDLIHQYLEARLRHVDHQDPGKRISRVTFTNYERSLRWVAGQIGGLTVKDLTPAVFTALAQKTEDRFGITQYNAIVVTTRQVFHWAVQNGLVAALPVYGTEFVSTNKNLRLDNLRHKPLKFFTASQIRALLHHAKPNMKAMILLGINCAYLQSDCAELLIDFGNHPFAKLHLGEDPYIRFDRVKTGERRKATLWPETVDALKQVIGDRKEGRVFVTRNGFPLLHQTAITDDSGKVVRFTNCDPTVKKFRELCVRAGLREKGTGETNPMYGLGFSSLRTTFETIAFTCQQLSVAHQAAIAWVMGHRISGVNLSKMADRYLQDIDTSTLALVTNHVHDWLFKEGQPTSVTPS